MINSDFLLNKFLNINENINIHHLLRYVKFMISLPDLNRKITYCESHHILPISLFPEFRYKTENPWNQKKITARQHFIAHRLLWLALVDNKEMTDAFWLLSNIRSNKVNSKIYEKLKQAKSTRQSELMTGNSNRLGIPHTEEFKNRFSESRKGSNNHFYGISLPDKVLDAAKLAHSKISSETRKEWWTNEAKSGLSQNKLDWHESLTDQDRESISSSISAGLKNKPKLICPHCNKTGGHSNMIRYHFDKCKSIILR